MFQGTTFSLNPIGPWPLLVSAAAAVLFLTLWAYATEAAGVQRPLARLRPEPTASGTPPLPAGGTAALGHRPGEEAAGRFARLPDRLQQKHAASR